MRSDGQSAETCYEVLWENEKYSLVRFILKTGRTHQIRVHMSHLGHPLVGDWLYGKEDTSIISRPALHSATLGFTHPMTNERIMLDCEMPEDLKKLIEERKERMLNCSVPLIFSAYLFFALLILRAI